MASVRRLGTLVVLTLIVCGGAYAFLMRNYVHPPPQAQIKPFRPPPPPPRPWRWPTEDQWVVHQIVRSLASWSALAHGQSGRDDVAVRQIDDLPRTREFAVRLTGSGDAREFRVALPTHIWDPVAYVPAAQVLLRGTAAPPQGNGVKGLDALLLAADTTSLRRADALLFAEMSRSPLNASLHEQAALLWAAHALRESDGYQADPRPFLNGVTAHLAIARGLRGDSAPRRDGLIANAILDALLFRQLEATDAIARLRELDPSGGPDPWTTALRTHITLDPRLFEAGNAGSRLEKLEAVRALLASHGCRAAVGRARSWGLRPSADWVRATVPECSEPERTDLTRLNLALQAADAARLIDAAPGNLDRTLASLKEAAANTHQPAPPTAVIPRHVRADAGQRHLASVVLHAIVYVDRFGDPREVKRLELETDTLLRSLPQRPLLEIRFALKSQGRAAARWTPPDDVCERTARLVADRPDLLGENSWQQAGRCQAQSLLNMVPREDWQTSRLPPATGRISTGPWRQGHKAGEALPEASRRAPWAIDLSSRLLLHLYRGEPPASEVKRAYGALLDYNLPAIRAVMEDLHDDDDEKERLAKRACEIDIEHCGWSAETLASLGRSEAGEPLWKKALQGSQDRISLSNYLGGYVSLLLDRGQTAEALRIARSAADVYSAVGLSTLGVAYERLGRFDDAAGQYARITERYQDKWEENTFYLRYRQRHDDGRFASEAERGMAELFPKGLLRKSLDDFRRDSHRGGILLLPDTLWAGLRRVGARNEDFLVAVDGVAVANMHQLRAVLTFTDEPVLSAIVMRGKGFIEVTGPYVRDKYGPAPKP